jgi:hypothetical protein
MRSDFLELEPLLGSPTVGIGRIGDFELSSGRGGEPNGIQLAKASNRAASRIGCCDRGHYNGNPVNGESRDSFLPDPADLVSYFRSVRPGEFHHHPRSYRPLRSPLARCHIPTE